ncbi:hypothetical protein B7759_05772 (plasmid) [Burkholderia glumae]|nr:hypothetical protein B7759_05772 [Burkholderia glumae]
MNASERFDHYLKQLGEGLGHADRGPAPAKTGHGVTLKL